MYVRPRLGFRQICTTFGLSLSDYIVCSFRHTLTHNRPRYLELRYLEPPLSRIPTISNPGYLESIPCYLQPCYLESIPCYLQPVISSPSPAISSSSYLESPAISTPGYLESPLSPSPVISSSSPAISNPGYLESPAISSPSFLKSPAISNPGISNSPLSRTENLSPSLMLLSYLLLAMSTSLYLQRVLVSLACSR